MKQTKTNPLVMIVDDERNMCELIETDLRLRGIASKWYTSASEENFEEQGMFVMGLTLTKLSVNIWPVM